MTHIAIRQADDEYGHAPLFEESGR